ncbi:MAG: hypothetical protein JWO12_571 [Frankiales bacterium]|nr:hypothetical protein [Frankiales bacterium]
MLKRLLVALLLLAPAVPASAASRCPSELLVGAAKADITPTAWPVGEAAYSIGRLGYSAAHPFWARSVAIRSCATGTTVVITSLDSQGYFAAYKEDPLTGEGYGTDGIRAAAARATGVPAAHLVVASTHTHNSPDSVGVWGGGSQPNNKVPYLSRVKAQAVRSITDAVRALRPAKVLLGTADVGFLQSTVTQVGSDPKDYPIDTTLRVVQAVGLTDCRPITTVVNASIHATAAAEVKDARGRDAIDPDWPGRVATNLEQRLPGDVPVILPGAMGRTQTRFPKGQVPKSSKPLDQVAAYGDILTRRVLTALAGAKPVLGGQVAAAQAFLQQEVEDPALVALFYDEAGVPTPGGPPAVGGLMRSVLPPYTTGSIVRVEADLLRVGDLAIATVPAEGYPQNQLEVAKRVQARATLVVGLAQDQVGYSPPLYEYPLVALADGGDEGVFTINPHFGADLVNQHVAQAASLGFATTGSTYLGTGPIVPPGQFQAAPEPPLVAEPAERPYHPGCAKAPVTRPAAAPAPAARSALPATGAPTALLLGGLVALVLAGAVRRRV